MKNIQKARNIINTIVLGLFLNGNVFALSEVSTMESRVVTNSDNAGITTYMITGPGNKLYRIKTSPDDEKSFEIFVETNPNAIVRFDGTIEDLDGTKVFRINKWEDTNKTAKTAGIDVLGNTNLTGEIKKDVEP